MTATCTATDIATIATAAAALVGLGLAWRSNNTLRRQVTIEAKRAAYIELLTAMIAMARAFSTRADSHRTLLDGAPPEITPRIPAIVKLLGEPEVTKCYDRFGDAWRDLMKVIEQRDKGIPTDDELKPINDRMNEQIDKLADVMRRELATGRS